MSEGQYAGRTFQLAQVAGIVAAPETVTAPPRFGGSPVLQVEDLSICLLLHREHTGSIRDYVIRTLKGQRIDRDEFWPLREVSFTLHPGEIFGIIGANGAGKSTLLKVIAGIIPPSAGRVIARGRIAPLIELGAGFDPFLTGRENIFLYGALLGFSQKELETRFDRIVGFAELEEFIDVPLMNYSVGMAARLGFAIATDVEPDLLLIDELFSVGDVAFQKKCEERMETFKVKGVTILLVSHDLKLVQDTCHRTLCLHHGQVVALGPTDKVVAEYQQFSASLFPGQHPPS